MNSLFLIDPLDVSNTKTYSLSLTHISNLTLAKSDFLRFFSYFKHFSFHRGSLLFLLALFMEYPSIPHSVHKLETFENEADQNIKLVFRKELLELIVPHIDKDEGGNIQIEKCFNHLTRFVQPLHSS